MEIRECYDVEPHYAHEWWIGRLVPCKGNPGCDVHNHKPHTVSIKTSFWCGGKQTKSDEMEGYSWATLYPEGINIKVLQCNFCGAVVTDVATHDEFHGRKETPPGIFRS